MRYSLEHYDKQGFLRPPIWVWLGWLLLVKAWIILIAAGVSRENGQRILEYAYLDQRMLYIGLALGAPALGLMWLIALRSPERPKINAWVTWGYTVTVLMVVVHGLQSGYQIYQQHGTFSWLHGLTVLSLVWFMVYLLQSRSARDCFRGDDIGHNG